MSQPRRRRLLQGAAIVGGMPLIGLGGCAIGPAIEEIPPLAPVQADSSRISRITVCLRPFRAAGPRLDIEQIGDALVIHNYGHGGSGWSLSWGSSTNAVRKAMSGGPREVAVIGCGALGLTSAILAQNAGAHVTIYARELLPETRSARATGLWTPDSRIAFPNATPPGFAAVWEQMARVSFQTHRRYVGLPDAPVAWTDQYVLSDTWPADVGVAPDFAGYVDNIPDIAPASRLIPRGRSPFPTAYARRSQEMMFNIADYGRTLMTGFIAAGGKIQRMEFHAPAELALLKEKVVINCPGYGARALWRDESIIPVRGQIGWLIPQPEVKYGLLYRNVIMLSRHDGIVVQAVGTGDMKGFYDSNETPDRTETETAVKTIAELWPRIRTARLVPAIAEA